MMRKFVTAVTSGLIAAGLFAATAVANDMPKVRIGYLLSETVGLQLLHARDEGLFKARNVHVELIRFDNGTQMTQALVGGSLDGALAGAAVVSSIAVRGLGVLIAPTYLEYDTNHLYATKDSGIKSVADLKGKQVAYPFGTTAHVLVFNALKRAGLAQSDVKSVNMNYQATATALVSGAVSSAVIGSGYVMAVGNKGSYRITSLRDFYPDVAVLGGLVISNAYFKSNPSVLPNVVTGLIEAQAALNEEPARKKLYDTYFAKFHPYEAYDFAYQAAKFPSGTEWMASFKNGQVAKWALATAELLKEVGTLDRIGDPKDFLAPDVYAKGLEQAQGVK